MHNMKQSEMTLYRRESRNRFQEQGGRGICQPKIRLKKHFSELPGNIARQSLAIDRVASEAPDN